MMSSFYTMAVISGLDYTGPGMTFDPFFTLIIFVIAL